MLHIKKNMKKAAIALLLSTATLCTAVPVFAANPETVKSEEIKIEAAKNEVAENEAGKTEADKTEATKNEVAENEAGKTEAGKTEATKNEENKVEEIEALYTGSEFKMMGVLQYEGYRWTWYSERALPGTGLDIPGRHADESGYICDEDDFICVASRDLEKGTEVDTPFGKRGKVYDVCGISGTIDIYVNW